MGARDLNAGLDPVTASAVSPEPFPSARNAFVSTSEVSDQVCSAALGLCWFTVEGVREKGEANLIVCSNTLKSYHESPPFKVSIPPNSVLSIQKACYMPDSGGS